MDWERFYSLISGYRNGRISRERLILEWRLAQEAGHGKA
jgi:hypothetical protein